MPVYLPVGYSRYQFLSVHVLRQFCLNYCDNSVDQIDVQLQSQPANT